MKRFTDHQKGEREDKSGIDFVFENCHGEQSFRNHNPTKFINML